MDTSNGVETEICYIRNTVAIDISTCGLNVLTKDFFLAGNPRLCPKVGSDDYNIFLYDKQCGKLPDATAKLLCVLTTQKLAKVQVVVGVDAEKINHSFVIITLIANSLNAVAILSIVQNHFGALFKTSVSVPPLLAVQPGVRAVLNRNLKRPFQSLSDSNLLLSNTNDGILGKVKKQSRSTSVLPVPKLSLNSSHAVVATSSASYTTSLTPFLEPLSVSDRSKSNQTVTKTAILQESQASSTTVSLLGKNITDNSASVVNTFAISSTTTLSTVTSTTITAASTKTSSTDVSGYINLLLSNIRSGINSINNQSLQLIGNNQHIKTVVASSNQRSPLTLNTITSVPATVSSEHSMFSNDSTMDNHLVDWADVKIKQEKDDTASVLHHQQELETKEKSILSTTIITYEPTNTQTNATMTNPSLANATLTNTIPFVNDGLPDSSFMNSIEGQPKQSSSFSVLMKSLLDSNSLAQNSSVSDDTVIQADITYQGELTNLSDLPSDILAKLQAFRETPSRFADTSVPSLVNERGSSGNVCDYLLGRVQLPNDTDPSTESDSQKTSNFVAKPDDPESDSDEEINFSTGMLARRRQKRRTNPCDHIGADANELYEDPADVSIRNWGIFPTGVDPADELFAKTPKPIVKKDRLDELFDLMSEFDKNTPIEPCQAIRQSLLPHQKTALNWMIERENTKELPPFWECISIGRDYVNISTGKRVTEKPVCANGGILADDMGLGKTLTTISLILTNHLNGKSMFKQNKALPTSACEIANEDGLINIKKKKEGYVKAKATTKTDLNKPGFKFRQLYLQQLGKEKKKKKKKKKNDIEKKEHSMFQSDSDDEKQLKHITKHVDSIIHSTSGSSGINKGRLLFGQKSNDRKSTLIVCPMSVLSNWTNQLQEHVDPSFNIQIYIFYGPERVRDVDYLKKYDIIITTYGTLTCDFRGVNTKGKPSPLHQINWLRVILDEGHIIRNARSQQTSAAMGLIADRRWLLTGTPIQNRMTDLWSMVKFLRLEPFTNRSWWFQYVVESMKRQPNKGEVIFNRVFKIVNHIAIRRMKTDTINGKPIVNLPKRTVIVQKIKFSEDEQKLYDAMQKDGKLVICKYFRENTVLTNYANVLAIIMRLRQLCCHPKLCAKAVQKLEKAMLIMDQFRDQMQGTEITNDVDDETTVEAEMSDADREKLIQQLMQLLMSGDSEECSICLENLKDPIITRCAHVFCFNCINEVIESSDISATCPLCRADIDEGSMVKVPSLTKTEEDAGQKSSIDVEDDDDEPWHSSVKVDFVMKALEAQRQKDPRMKSLVVSQFTSFLDVLQKPIREAGFEFVRFDGTMSQKARTRVIDEFNDKDDSSPTLMLLSLTAGGVGLNLTAATRVFLLDPAWNPAIEEQCFDRCHRLGQTEDVLIIKVVVENTVEDRMLILQKQKRELMQKAFGMAQKNPEERRAATLRNISTLLGLDIPGMRTGAGRPGGQRPPSNLIALGGNRRTLPT